MVSRNTIIAVSAFLLPSSVYSEEGGSGHYLPGSMASFMDGVPQEETFLTRLNYLYYSGNVEANHRIPIAGLSTLGADATSTALGLTVLWRPPVDIGENWSWAMSATIPYVWMDVEANVVAPTPGGGAATVRRGKDISGIGDVVLMPLMFNYRVSDDVNVNFRVGAYAPTGRYQVGRLANTGKNYWTIEPAIAWMYFGKKNGREASVFLGADFNWENSDTNYKTGTQIHLDGTVAQHFPLWGGLAGVGLNAYWYEQVEGDSGFGATLGDLKGRTAGLGPAFSYVSSDGNTLGEVKWLHEFETKNRLEGNYIWFKLIHKF